MRLEIFDRFDKKWALVTAGPLSKHNSMTISWGELGTLWGKDVCTVYIKPCRYTYNFMEENDRFVVSFFPEKYRKALASMGSKSGRDIDKDKEAKLTPMEFEGVTVYKEAELTLICRKIYHADLIKDEIPAEEIKRYYQKEQPHRMYIGEIIKTLD